MRRELLIYIFFILSTIALAIGAHVVVTDNNNSDTYANEYVEEAIPLAIHSFLSNFDSEIEDTEKFDRTIKQFMRRYNLVGASLAIMRNDSLLYAKGYGYADTAIQGQSNSI